MKSSVKLNVSKHDAKTYTYYYNEKLVTNENGDTEYEYDTILVEADSIEDANIKGEKQIVKLQLEKDLDDFLFALAEANINLPSAQNYKSTKTRYDNIGKVVQTEEGDGSMENPQKWVEGAIVISEKWYKTPSNYIWQAIKTGVPSSEIDSEYFDIVGL